MAAQELHNGKNNKLSNCADWLIIFQYLIKDLLLSNNPFQINYNYSNLYEDNMAIDLKTTPSISCFKIVLIPAKKYWDRDHQDLFVLKDEKNNWLIIHIFVEWKEKMIRN